MTSDGNNSGKKLGFFPFAIFLWFFYASAPAYALSPRDLIIVFNRNLPESKVVAFYYAKKRQVPAANLVGVDVSTSEDMSRAEYDNKLVPPIKEMLEKAPTKARTPAILLVYGIPLRVGGSETTKADEELKTLAAAKRKEDQGQVQELVKRLNQLTGYIGTAPKKLTYPPAQLFKMAQESLVYASKYLNEKSESPPTESERAEINSLMVKLAGTSPEGRALMAMARRITAGKSRIERQELQALNAISKQEIEARLFRGILPETAQDTAAGIRSDRGLLGELRFWMEAENVYTYGTADAVDSELTLILAGPYQRHGWLPNPFHLVYDRLPLIDQFRDKPIMVGRLDGPTPEIARRLVDDALEIEKVGLKGVFYIDARGLAGKGNDAYAQFDQHLLHLYEEVKKLSPMKVVLDNTPQLFAPGSCPDAALYCGWYSGGTYIPAFRWVKGAVGYHVASYEATTLKKPGSTVWCKRMLEEGVAATLGPVGEPYLHSFPLPDLFFPLLMTGKLPLLEVYFRTVPSLSWEQILIGDPLYTPFKVNPAIRGLSPAKSLSPSDER